MLSLIFFRQDKIYRCFFGTEFFDVNTRIETENLLEFRVDERVQP